MRIQTRPKTHTDILFVSMPSRANSVLPPLGFMVLSGFLDKHTEFSSAVFERKISSLLEVTPARTRVIEQAILTEIERQQPRFVGFSLFPGDLPDFLLLAQRIKSRFPALRIVVGGVLPTIDPKSLLCHDSPVDVVIRGDGELPLRQLLSGGAPTQMPGLAWREGDNLNDTGVADYLGELDYIPSYHKVDMAYYCQVSTEIIRPYYTRGMFVFSAVGCPHRCSFCFNPKTKLKYKNLDIFIDELRLLKETYGINSFFILDECFLANKARAAKFCDRYKESGIGLPWAMQTRSNLLTEENIGVLKNAGCVHISFGVETGSPRLLQEISKGLTVEDHLFAFDLCRKYGIKTFANLLYNLPGETLEDLELSRRFLQKARPDHVAISLTVPLLGTRIYHDFVKPPLTPEEYVVYGSNAPYTRIVDRRFRLAAHDLALDKLLAKESIRYYLKTSFGLLSREPWYVHGVLRRTPLSELGCAIGKKVLQQLRAYGRGALQLVRGSLANLGKTG